MQTDALIGRTVDDFLIEERIGRGGMASVYRAHQPSIRRSIALKVITLDSSLGEDNEFRLRFEQEAKLIASLEHIHILPVYDYGIVNNELAYLAMRLLRGGSLADLLRNGPLHPDRTADIFTQIARGLAYAHSKGVIHRDLKPSNILLDDAGNAYLTDFGLAKLTENALELTKTGNIVGTPVYMSPEQLRGDAVDQRSDIYSLGVILYHMLVGRPPFDASDSNVVSVIYQHLEKSPVPPNEANPDVSPAVALVAMTALHKDSHSRYQNAVEMADDLNAALGRSVSSTGSHSAIPVESGSTLHTMAVPPPRQRTPTSRRGWRRGLITAVLLLIALAGVAAGIAHLQSLAPERLQPTILAGTTGTAAEAVPSTEEQERARAYLGATGFIAYIACNQSSEYHATQAREMADQAERYGTAFRVYDSDSDAYRQVTLLERARTDGASALIVCPLDTRLLDNALQAAQAAGMPLVFMHSDMSSYGGVLLAGDDYLMGLEAGRAGGRLVASTLSGEANVIVLDYPDLPGLVRRADGLEAGIREIVPEAHLIGRFLGATRENGYQSIHSLIEDGVDFNVILSINDAGSYGAIQALEEAGISPADVLISSVDAEALAQEYIADDYFIRASVEVGREQFSSASIDATVRLLAGGTLPEIFLMSPGRVVTRVSVESTHET